ncbi:RnfH family protein [Legionella cardiaca]|uniref:RnfH family protein n=1 Tax=Legionella cardiaca TaxID=1071983 RepID=UPI0030845DC2
MHLKLSLKSGATIADALVESNLLITNPEIKDYSVGIFAKIKSRDTILKSGDRIEIYRPLALDPKEKRRQRAKTKEK